MNRINPSWAETQYEGTMAETWTPTQAEMVRRQAESQAELESMLEEVK